jgi:type IV secretion system protein VirB2
LLSQPAFAQAAASTADGITLMLTNIESWLTGGIARIVAVIAVILVGFAFLAGRATFGLLVTVIIGIFIVFSAGWFVSTITNGAITTQ